MHDDNACLKCGRCCRVRKNIRGEMFAFPWYRCQHLNLDTKLCDVYAERFAKYKNCLTVEQGIQDRAYPRDCPYVKGLTGYRPPVEVKDEEAANKFCCWW